MKKKQTRRRRSLRIDSVAELLLAEKGGSETLVNVPKDFKEFASTCRIKSGSNFVPFDLYDYQVLLGELLDKYPRHCWFKTRQLGASETITAKMLHRSLLNPAYTGVTFSIGQKESSKLADRAKKMPQGQGINWEYESGQRLKAVGGGDLFFYPSTQNAARSLSSVTDEFFDEAGFIPKFESLYASAIPAQEMAGANAGRFLVSTMPEDGALSPWWQIFIGDCPGHIDVEEKLARIREERTEYGFGVDYWIDNAGWCKVLIHWKAHPIYSLVGDYLEQVKQKQKISDNQLYREYDLRIPSSTGSLFNLEEVKRQAVGKWRSPEPGHKYLLGIDPNFGGDDYYTALVFDITSHPFELVYQVRINKKTNLYCEQKALEVIDQYHPVLVAIESNSGGVVLMEHLQAKRPQLRVESVSTSNVSKRINTDRVAIAIESGDVIYPPDWQFCSGFVENDQSYPSEASQFLASTREAVSGHDDTVMAFAVAWAWLDVAIQLSNKQYNGLTASVDSRRKGSGDSRQARKVARKEFGRPAR